MNQGSSCSLLPPPLHLSEGSANGVSVSVSFSLVTLVPGTLYVLKNSKCLRKCLLNGQLN